MKNRNQSFPTNPQSNMIQAGASDAKHGRRRSRRGKRRGKGTATQGSPVQARSQDDRPGTRRGKAIDLEQIAREPRFSGIRLTPEISIDRMVEGQVVASVPLRRVIGPAGQVTAFLAKALHNKQAVVSLQISDKASAKSRWLAASFIPTKSGNYRGLKTSLDLDQFEETVLKPAGAWYAQIFGGAHTSFVDVHGISMLDDSVRIAITGEGLDADDREIQNCLKQVTASLFKGCWLAGAKKGFNTLILVGRDTKRATTGWIGNDFKIIPSQYKDSKSSSRHSVLGTKMLVEGIYEGQKAGVVTHGALAAFIRGTDAKPEWSKLAFEGALENVSLSTRTQNDDGTYRYHFVITTKKDGAFLYQPIDIDWDNKKATAALASAQKAVAASEAFGKLGAVLAMSKSTVLFTNENGGPHAITRVSADQLPNDLQQVLGIAAPLYRAPMIVQQAASA